MNKYFTEKELGEEVQCTKKIDLKTLIATCENGCKQSVFSMATKTCYRQLLEIIFSINRYNLFPVFAHRPKIYCDKTRKIFSQNTR